MTPTEARAERLKAVRERMLQIGVDVLLLSLGADLPWLTGYTAMPLERLTMLVVPAAENATLVVPRLEAPRVAEQKILFSLRSWEETEDPIDIVAGLIGKERGLRIALSDRTWARVVLELQGSLPADVWAPASQVTAPLRAVKDAAEIDALASAARAADLVAEALLAGEIPLVGRSESSVSSDIARRLVEAGHDRVNFAIVASGPNAASPHHDPGERVIEPGDPVVCDFGGSMIPADERAVGGSAGYCSDITRTVVAGGRVPEGFIEIYDAVASAREAAVEAATIGTTCNAVDRAARSIIETAGYGEFFLHRTGHGIGVEEHEDPFIVETNVRPLVEGNAFSVEPGIYVGGRYGVRIEDIVVATEAGSRVLNRASRDLVVVEA